MCRRARAEGARIETIEGLAGMGPLTPVQKAFHKTGASQCGYCIPGMVMAATNCLRLNPEADLDEIKERMGGNICRCTGYTKILEAVEIARDVIAGAAPRAIWMPTSRLATASSATTCAASTPRPRSRGACATPPT